MTSYQGNIVIKNPATPTGPFENGTAPGIWKLNEVLAFKRQGIWPTQGIQGPDPYFEYVSLLLSTTSLSNANNNLFVDSSGAFNPISRNGNPTQGSAIPYGTNWSNYFDGSGDWVQFASTSQFAIATSTTPFTIEAWIYPTAAGSCIFTDAYTGGGDNIPITISLSNGVSVDAISGRYVALGYFTGSAWVTAAKANSEVSLNMWTHIACVFTGSTFKIYYNGVDVTAAGAGSSWGMTGNSGSAWYIGRRWDIAGNDYFTGYISNLRFVNGTAVYTSAFTPPTTPLTAITNTVLLTCQSNRFRDASSNNFTPTRNGDVRVTDFSPFNPTYPGMSYNQSDITNWSGYFDGSGDYLSVPDNTALDFETGDFTVEMWVYFPSTVSSSNTFIAGWTTGEPVSGWTFGADGTNFYFGSAVSTVYSTFAVNTAARTPGTWHHVAAVRSSGNVTVYVNGVGGTPVSNTQNITTAATGLNIGRSPYTANPSPFTGYISNLRMVKGTAVYTGNFTPPTTNLTAISGTSLLTLQNAAFTDNSTNNFVITPNGNTTVTGNSPFNTVGYWSNYFDGSGDWLTIPNNAAFSYGTGDFTMEVWVYKTATSGDRAVVDSYTLGSGGGTFGFLINDTQIVGYQTNVASYTFTYTVPNNSWNHIAFVRTGGNLICYVNGTSIGSQANSTNFVSASTIDIGRNAGSGGSQWIGYLSNLRVVKGTAVYTSNFTVPTTPLTAISGTSLLTCQASRIIDSSTNAFTITRNGDVSVQSFDPFYTSTTTSSGGSMYFDGSGDYVNAPTSPLFGLGTSNYTIEMWVYPTANPGNGPGTIFDLRTGPTATATVARINSSLQLLVYNGPANVEFVTGTVPLKAWTHIALVRSSGSLTTYINGASSNTTALSSDLGSSQPCFIGINQSAGYEFNGYISDFRITKGTAVYTSAFTPPSTPLTPTAATTLLVNGMNAGIFDAAAVNNIETVGNSQVSTVQSKFGGSSVYFDGSSRLTMPPTVDMDLSSGDFTVEAWVYSTTLSGTGSAATRAAAGNITSATELQWGIYRSGSSMIVRPYQSTTDFSINVGTIAANTWYHVAMTRSGNTIRGFLNGVLAGTTQTISGALNNNAAWFGAIIGGITVSGGSEYWNGYIDDLRVTKGYARYTSTFTPPTQPFVNY